MPSNPANADQYYDIYQNPSHVLGSSKTDGAVLKQIAPDYVIPMHCTGEPFYEIKNAEMPEKLLRSYTGSQFNFET